MRFAYPGYVVYAHFELGYRGVARAIASPRRPKMLSPLRLKIIAHPPVANSRVSRDRDKFDKE